MSASLPALANSTPSNAGPMSSRDAQTTHSAMWRGNSLRKTLSSDSAVGNSLRFRLAIALVGLSCLVGCTETVTRFDETEPERQFDFWIGDWAVRNVQRGQFGSWEYKDEATAEVRSVLGGRAIVEQWRHTGDGKLRGFSIRTYDAEEQRWEIILNWHSGQPSSYSMMTGTFGVNRGEFFPPSPQPTIRYTFTNATAESCIWEQAALQRDDWTTSWVMEFSRTGPAADLTADNLPINAVDSATASEFPGARQLDYLIGNWDGEVTRTLNNGDTEPGRAKRRVSPIIDGLALLCLTSYSWDEESISVLAFNAQTGGWDEVGMSTDEADCHWLQGASVDGVLRLNETSNSDNGIATKLTTTDALQHQLVVQRTNPTSADATVKIEAAFTRSDEAGKVEQIPEFTATPMMQLNRAQLAMQAEDFEQAEKLLAEFISGNGGTGRVWFQLGYVQQSLKKYDAAKISYAKAVRTSPSAVPAVEYNLACLSAVQDDRDDAFRHLQLATDAGFNNPSQVKADPDFNNIRNDVRFAKFAGGAAADDFVEPTRVIHELIGENAGDQFGWTARLVGDWDQDGVQDFVATAPTHQGKGKVYVYSGKTSKLLFQQTGKPGEQFGNTACGVGDLNGDGHVDLAVGAPNSKAAGNAYVYSGKDGSVIHHWAGAAPGDGFGYEVTNMSDIDGDDCPDVFVGAARGSGEQASAGYGVVYSGKTGAELLRLLGEKTGDQFGNAAGFMKNSDGSATLAIGAQNAGDNNRGRVYVYRLKGTAAAPAFVIEGDDNSRNLGQMFVTSPGDTNADGFADIYVSDFSDNTDAQGGGKVRIVSGKDGSDLLVITGKHPREGLGTSPSDAGDVNGDGVGDLVIGAWNNAEAAAAGGKVYLYDGKSGELIRQWTCKTGGDTFGFDACGIGDVDGDGNIDFLLTSAWHNSKQGRVFILAGGETPLEEEQE